MDDVTDANFDNEVLKAATPVLVDFYTTWCPPCKVLSPKLDELSQEMTTIKFVKADVGEEQRISEAYDVQCVPSLIIFNGGEVLGRKEGLLSKPDLKQWIEDTLKG